MRRSGHLPQSPRFLEPEPQVKNCFSTEYHELQAKTLIDMANTTDKWSPAYMLVNLHNKPFYSCVLIYLAYESS